MTVKNGGCTIVCSELGWLYGIAHYISRDCGGWGGYSIPNIAAKVWADTLIIKFGEALAPLWIAIRIL